MEHKIIKNCKKEKDDFFDENYHGVYDKLNELKVTEEEIQRLINGDCLAFSIGDNPTIITVERKE